MIWLLHLVDLVLLYTYPLDVYIWQSNQHYLQGFFFISQIIT